MRIEAETKEFKGLYKWHIRCVLECIDARDLRGIGAIRMIERCPDDTHANNQEPYLRGFLYNGHYSKGLKDAHYSEVVLYRDDIYFGVPTLLLVSPVAILRVARTLAHEVGHHVTASLGYQTRRKQPPLQMGSNPYSEKRANEYAQVVINRMLQQRVYKVGRRISTLLSSFFYKAGIQDYWNERFQSSAQLLFRSYILNPLNEEAGQAYRHAIEKLRTQFPSPLSPQEQAWLSEYYNPYPNSTGRLKRSKLDAL